MAVHVRGGGHAKIWESIVGGRGVIIYLQDTFGVTYTLSGV